jgi:hypothetical protein
MGDICGDWDDGSVCKYLHDRGWILTNHFEWIQPIGPISPLEYDCIQFLFEEWDYGFFFDGSSQILTGPVSRPCVGVDFL